MNLRTRIENWAIDLGFQQIGFAKADFLEEEAPLLEKWLKNGFHGQMQYMENWFDKRLDPRLLVDGAKTVIVLTYNYYQEENVLSQQAPKISQYAYGKDYHFVIKEKLNELIFRIEEVHGAVQSRGFVDSAPVLERAWAKKAGIGWNGKHTLMINKNRGSFFFLATIIIDLELEESSPFTAHHCGTCTKCIDACPTEAIIAPEIVDARKCISYLTIELKDAIPDEFKGKMDGWMYGCDVCQQVCPWNRFSIAHQEPAFKAAEQLLSMTLKDWQEMTQQTFSQIFSKSAVKRTKFIGLKRNLEFLDLSAKNENIPN